MSPTSVAGFGAVRQGNLTLSLNGEWTLLNKHSKNIKKYMISLTSKGNFNSSEAVVVGPKKGVKGWEKIPPCCFLTMDTIIKETPKIQT